MNCIEIYKIDPLDIDPDMDLSSQEFEDIVSSRIQPAIDEYVIKHKLPRVGRGWKLINNESAAESALTVDDVKEEQSVYTVKVFLNSSFSGGEFNFVHRDVVSQVSPGDILIYPSSYINAYKVMPVTSGSQKYLVNKYRFPGTAEG